MSSRLPTPVPARDRFGVGSGGGVEASRAVALGGGCTLLLLLDGPDDGPLWLI